MRIVLLTGPGLAHRYMANRLAAELSLTAIVVDHGRPRTVRGELSRLLRKYTPGEIAGRLCLELLHVAWREKKRRTEALLRVFGADACADFVTPALVHRVSGINTPAGHRVVSGLAPDLLLVFGTGIVSTSILHLARALALNAHTGLSPYYRGAECSFWPVHNGEPHMLGATVHVCTREIDGGDILATRPTSLLATDCLHAIHARCVVTAADLYIEVVKDILNGRVTRSPQALYLGREYRAHMHGLRAELRARRLVRGGLIARYARERLAESAPGRDDGQTAAAGPVSSRD